MTENIFNIKQLNLSDIEIITPAKCGSESFRNMLLNPCIISNVYKSHHHVTTLIKDIITEKKDHLIIIGIRNPIKRNMSFFFEPGYNKFYDIRFLNYLYPIKSDDENKNDMDKFHNFVQNNDINSLIKLYFESDFHNSEIMWIKELFEITNINLDPFDKEIGYKLYKLQNNNYIFIYTLEKINNNINFINNFFGKEYKYKNDTNRYYSSNVYDEFKNTIKFTKSYKDEMLNNPFIKYFYTDKDIDTFYNEYPTI